MFIRNKVLVTCELLQVVALLKKLRLLYLLYFCLISLHLNLTDEINELGKTNFKLRPVF